MGKVFFKKFIINTSICVVLFFLEIFLFEYSGFDVYFQNFFFDTTKGTWLISPTLHKTLNPFLYTGPKVFDILLAVACLFLFVFGYFTSDQKIKSYRKGFLIMVLSIAFVPLLVSGAKKYTNVYCPGQLSIYNGDKPYVYLFSSYPEDFVQERKGRCFPAGHSTGGFALMALFFVFKKRKNRLIGLTVGLSAGWIMGTYQTFRGEHFVSHTVTSMIASWFVIYTISLIVDYFFDRKKS